MLYDEEGKYDQLVELGIAGWDELHSHFIYLALLDEEKSRRSAKVAKDLRFSDVRTSLFEKRGKHV